MATKKTYEGARRPAPKFNFMPKQQDSSATDAAMDSAAAAASDDEAPIVGIPSDDEEPEDLVETSATTTMYTERDLRRSTAAAADAGGLSRLQAEAAEQTILSSAFETPTTYNPLQKRQIKINLGTVPAPGHAAASSGQSAGASLASRPLLPNPAELALGQGYVLQQTRPQTPPTPTPPPLSTMSTVTPAPVDAVSSGRPRTPPTPTPPPLQQPPLSSVSSSSGRFQFDFSRPPPGFEQYQQRQPPMPPIIAPSAARGPLLGDRPVSEQTRRSLPLPSQLPLMPRPPLPPAPMTMSSSSSSMTATMPTEPPRPPMPPTQAPGRRVLLDEPILADSDQQQQQQLAEDEAEVKQSEQFLEQLEAWLAHIKSYESDMNEYFQSCAKQMHEHYTSAEQTEESKKVHEAEYRKLYDEYEKFSAYMRQMSQHYEDTKTDLEQRRAAAIEQRDKRLAERRALREKQLAAHAEPIRNSSAADLISSDSLLVEAYGSNSASNNATSSASLATSTATAAAVSALSRMDLSDLNSWNKFAASLPANADKASYYSIYTSQMAANLQRMLIGFPAAEAERLTASMAAAMQADQTAGDSGNESDGGLAGGLTLQGLTRNQRKKLRKRAKALQDAKAAKRQHRKLLLAAPNSANTVDNSSDLVGSHGDTGDATTNKDLSSATDARQPTPPPGYIDPAGDPRLVMQDYFERFANGEWNYATWNQYITVMQRHNPAWYEVFIAQSKQHGINWDDMYRYYTGGKVADHLSDLTGGRLTSKDGASPSILELASQPAPPPPPERLFDDEINGDKVELGDLVELDALDNNDNNNASTAKKDTADKEDNDDDGEDDDEDEDDDDEDDDWSFCKLCNQEFRTERGYLAHLRGVTHMKHALDRAASKKPHMFREERARQAEAVKAEATAQQKHQIWMEAQVGAIKRTGLGGTFECLLCNVKCNSQKSLDFHVGGDKHKKLIEERVKALEAVQREKEAAEAAELAKQKEAEAAQKAEAEAKLKAEQPTAAAKPTPSVKPQKQQKNTNKAKPTLRAQTLLNSCLEPLLGLQYVTEYQRVNPMLECRCYCELCNLNFPLAELVEHATGIRHRRLFLKFHYPDLFAILSQDRSLRSVKIRRYAIYAQLIEDWEGRKKMNLKVEVPDESGDVDHQMEPAAATSASSNAAASKPSKPTTKSAVKYTLKSTKRPRNAAGQQPSRNLEEGEIDVDAEQSDNGEESDPEEGEALDNAGPPDEPGVVFEDAIVIDREPLTSASGAAEGRDVDSDIVATREAFIRRLREQKFLSASEPTKEALDSFGREADWAIKRKKRAAGIVEDDADLIKFGTDRVGKLSDVDASTSAQQQQQQQQQHQQHMTSLVEQIRAMTGINLGISRTQTEAFRIPSIPGLRLDIDRIKDTTDPVAQMRNLVSQIQEFVAGQKAVGYAAGPVTSSSISSTTATARLGLLSSGPAAPTTQQQQQTETDKKQQHKHHHKDKKEKKEKKRERKERERKEKERQQKLMGAVHLPGGDTIIPVTKQHKKKKEHKKQSKRSDEKERDKRDKDRERAKAKEKQAKKDKEKEKDKERKLKRRRERDEDQRDSRRDFESRVHSKRLRLPAPDSLGIVTSSANDATAIPDQQTAVFDAYSLVASSAATSVGNIVSATTAGLSTHSSSVWTNSAAATSRKFPGSSSSSTNSSDDDDEYVEKSADWLASLARNSLYGKSAAANVEQQKPPAQPVLLGLMGGSLPPPPQQPHQQQQQQPARTQPLLATPSTITSSNSFSGSNFNNSFNSSRPPMMMTSSTLGLMPAQQQQATRLSYLPPPETMMQPAQHQQSFMPPMQYQGFPNSNYSQQLPPPPPPQQQQQQPMFHPHHSLPPPSQFMPQQPQPPQFHPHHQQQQQQQLYQPQQTLLPPPVQQTNQQLW